jgi:MFS family permease
MGCAMMLWAVVSALTAVSKDFTGLLLTRFFLGLTEAPYYPGAVYLLSIFYTRKEVATRIAILYTGNILATAFAGLIAAGIFHGMDGAGGLRYASSTKLVGRNVLMSSTADGDGFSSCRELSRL